MTLALIVALPFLGALFPGLTIRAGYTACAGVAAAFAAVALGLLLSLAPGVLQGQVVTAGLDWLPQIGLAARLRLDGLGLLFSGLILGIGLLILLYARHYLGPGEAVARFYAVLMGFMGAMQGIVLSDNILFLFVFWELTSLTSFLLIGFWSHLPQARQGARMALAVTGGGGLALLAGLLMLGQIAGTHEISQMLDRAEVIRSAPLYPLALGLILLGCFAKSAQFPLHFWLPHAMAAPTPVSAYLHSATMVKAGIFLMARLWPVLGGTPEWYWAVTGVGLLTLLVGAKTALFQHDLKAILAYSTVSQLGLITALLGLGSPAAVAAALFHLLNHATFKAALFMTAGIVDHATHSRDIRRMGGFLALMPITATLMGIAALSMAGLPPLNGFLSKEMMLDAARQAPFGPAWLPLAAITAGSLLSAAYSYRLIAHGLLGSPRDPGLAAKAHDPGPGLWLAPALLVGLVVLIGLLPMLLAAPLIQAAALSATGGPMELHIQLWHGLNLPLALSALALGAGAILLAGHARLQGLWHKVARPDGKRLFDLAIQALTWLARQVAHRGHAGRLTGSLVWLLLALLGLGAFAFVTGTHTPGNRAPTAAPPVALALWVSGMGALGLILTRHRQRIEALVLVGMIGLLLAIGFAWLSAPDLALTQITVEVVSILLMLLALNFLPQTTPAESTRARRWRDGVLAGLAGLATGGLAYAMMFRDAAFAPISLFHLAQSKPGAGGTNAVNTIIVDFRGFDTFGEITVLGIAGLVIFALAATLTARGPARLRLQVWRSDRPQSGDRHPMMLVVATRLMLPVTLMAGVYLFLRGHNLPGGGFIAGLVFAIGQGMQYMASGHGWTMARLRADYHVLLAAGLLVATLTGAGAWLFGLPFLTSGHGYLYLGPLDKIEWATAALFDLGVLLTVLGAVMLALASLAQLALQTGQSVNKQAYDIEPEDTRGGASWKP